MKIEEIEKILSKCARCGYCRFHCPVFKSVGWESFSPRGRVILIMEFIEETIELENILASIFSCTLCGCCEYVCPSHVQVCKAVRELRAMAMRRGKE